MMSASGAIKASWWRLLRTKIILATVGLCLVSCLAIGFLAADQASVALQAAQHQRLSLIAQSQGDALNEAFDKLHGTLAALAGSSQTVRGLETLQVGLAAGDGPKLRDYYDLTITTPEQRAEMTAEETHSIYAWRHKEIHPTFYQAWQASSLIDIYLVNHDGIVVYSVTKSEAFLRHVKTLSDDGLSGAVVKAKALEPGTQWRQAFQRTESGISEAIVAQPVYEEGFAGVQTLRGVVLIRIGTRFLDDALTRRNRDSGVEFSLIRSDGSAVWDTAFGADLAQKSPLSLSNLSSATMGRADLPNIGPALLGVAGVNIGEEAYRLVASMAEDIALGPINDMVQSILAATSLVIAIAIAGFAGGIFGASMTRPITDITKATMTLAAGQTNIDLTGLRRRDEIGEMAKAVKVFRDNAVQKQVLETEREDMLEQLRSQTQRLQEALDREKELNSLQRQFVSMVSHEFRTPLAVIDGNAQRLIRRIETVK